MVFGRDFDHAPVEEDSAFALSCGDAKVGFAGFARIVDEAADHGDAQDDGEVVKCYGDLFGEGMDIDLGASAQGAGSDFQTEGPQTEKI